MVVATKEGTSIRSLTSLQLVPPPTQKNNNSGELEKWDPFPAPYAPHAQRGQSDETRDGLDCRPAPYAPHAQRGQPDETRDGLDCRPSSSDEIYTREEAEPTREDAGQRKTPRGKTSRAARTPPKIPQRQTETAYYSSERKSHGSSSRSRSRSSSGSKLIKVTATGSVTGESKSTRRSLSTPRSDRSHHLSSPQTSNSAAGPSPNMQSSSSKKKQRSFSPMILTRGRIDQHLREQSQNDKRTNVLDNNEGQGGLKDNDSASTDNQGSERIIPSSQSSSKQKVFMIGTTKVVPRTLIPPTVYHNTATDLWIVTINSNSKLATSIANSSQNNNDSVKAFSFRTEKEARASAYANAPPIMIPFDSCQECKLCATKFTLFKRPRHCRNCGICVCSSYSCSTVWSKRMVPETFNIKKENAIKVCTSCDSLTKRFRHALLQGRYGTAVELYLTGNINLRVPFIFKGKNKENMFPIHCAIEGKSEKLLRWLVDVQHCPIHVISTGNTKGSGVIRAGVMKSINETLGTGAEKKKPDFVPTLKTSKGRSVIDIAMETRHVGILRYLINEKNVSVNEVEELELALGAVEALAKAFPVVDGSYDPDMFRDKKSGESHGLSNVGSSSSSKERSNDSDGGGRGRGRKKDSATKRAVAKKTKRGKATGSPPKKERVFSHSIVSPPKEKMILPRDIHGVPGLYGEIGYDNDDSDVNGYEDEEHDTIVLDDDKSVSTTVPEICILCQEKDIDCVATPCGHQMCCLTCSNQCLRCPACNMECHFIEIYQP